MPSDMHPGSNVNVQVLTGAPAIELGHVALIIYNCPMIEVQLPNLDENGALEMTLVPGIKLNARQAMEIGMNLIHIAKISEQFAVAQEG